MKLKVLSIFAGTALMLQSANASAHTDVYVGLEFGIPLPVIVAPYPVYGHERDVVYYDEYRAYPRRYVYRPRNEVRHYERHDRGRHRGHRHHR